MIKRIDLFMPVRSQYGVLHHFTVELAEALNRQGVKCRILEAQRENPKPFLEQLFSDPPECTLSFNGLLPDDEGHFFCEMIQIPHVACIVDSPNHFVSLARSPYTIITCTDKIGCDFFKGLHQENVIFMPHGVDPSLVNPLENDRKRDVIVLASFIDDEFILASWKQKYPPSLCKALEEAAEEALSNPATSYIQALVDSLNRQLSMPNAINPKEIDFIDVLDELVMYMKGKDRIDLVKAIKDAKVDIFGSTREGQRSWKECLGSKYSNITCHDPISYQHALEEMKESKIVLNSYPWVSYGAHERLFASYACGALPLTTENEFLKKTFTNKKNIVFYRYGKLQHVNGLINQLLENDEKRNRMVEEGQRIVLEHHTWDHRAQSLLQDLVPILKKIKEESEP